VKRKRAILGMIISLVALIGAGRLLIPIFVKVHQAQINQQLVVAVKALKVSEVRDCLQAGADPNLQTSVAEPVSFWQYFLQLILHRPPPPSATDGTPLLTDLVTCDQVIPTKAELRKRADIALLLLHSGADINWSDLVSAADLDMWDVVKVLVQHGVDVDVEENGNNYTPLNIAAEANQTEAALWLLDHGADPNHQSRHYRYTAAMMAALNGNETLIRALIKKKADLTLTDKYDETALKYARYNKNWRLVELLKRYGMKK
jgi:ankyrin repeat protein